MSWPQKCECCCDKTCLLASVRCFARHLFWLHFGNPHFQHSQSGHHKRTSIRRYESYKQPYKPNRTLLVAISLPWVVNHSVCHREVYVVCAQSATTSKLWEGAKREGARRVLSPFSNSRSTSKDPAYNIRCRHFVCLTGSSSQKVHAEALNRWEQIILKASDPSLYVGCLKWPYLGLYLHAPSENHENVLLVNRGPELWPQITADMLGVTTAELAGSTAGHKLPGASSDSWISLALGVMVACGAEACGRPSDVNTHPDH